MTQGSTTNLLLATVQASDTLPEAVVKANFELIDTYVAATRMTNKSGGTLISGTVVVPGTTDSSVNTTTTANNAKTVGVAQETIANDAAGIVKHYGTSIVRVTGTTAIGDWLVTSATPGQATPITQANPPNGAFAIALTARTGAGTITALLLSVGITGAVVLPSSVAPTPTSEGAAEWDSNDDFLLVGTGATTKRFFSDNQGSNIASATTLTIGSDKYYEVTGTTTIAGATSNPAGQEVILKFQGALTLTYNATSFILSNAASRVTVPGEILRLLSLGSGNWQEISTGVTGPKIASADQTVNNSTTLVSSTYLKQTVLANTKYYIRVFLPYLTSNTPNIKFGILGPASASCRAIGEVFLIGTGNWTGVPISASDISTPANLTAIGVTGEIREARIEGIVTVAAAAGTVTVQFAQQTANVSDTTLLAGARLELVKVS